MSDHLGADLAAFVDGEVDHATRERVLRHLTRCGACRAEVEEQRRYKARLRELDDRGPGPSLELFARLRAVPEASDVPAGPLRPPSAPRTPSGPRRPRGRSPLLRRAGRRAVGGAVLALGIGAVLALGGPQRTPTRAPLDPATDAFLVDHASTSSELPLPEPAGVTSAGLGR